jgi:hypothetical protein
MTGSKCVGGESKINYAGLASDQTMGKAFNSYLIILK